MFKCLVDFESVKATVAGSKKRIILLMQQLSKIINVNNVNIEAP